jgi:hypothetical protein
MIRGSVDSLSNIMASGWIFTDAQKTPLVVEAILNHQVIGRATANLLRPDIAAAGLGDGHCGFELRFDYEIEKLFVPFIHIRPADTDLELRRWGATGFGDYFRELHEQSPRAGRQASVYGGLWTDRADASAVLKGKTDIGQIAARDANLISRYINDGVAALARRTEVNPAARKEGPQTPAVVADMLFDEDVLRVLRSVFEDHPVAISAERVEIDESEPRQPSAIQELPSPAECVALIMPATTQPISVDVIRGSHRLPEFTPAGRSRWLLAAGQKSLADLVPPDTPVDRCAVAPGNALLVGPGVLHYIRPSPEGAIRAIAVPARLALLRFYKKAPQGELSHSSGARVWV